MSYILEHLSSFIKSSPTASSFMGYNSSEEDGDDETLYSDSRRHDRQVLPDEGDEHSTNLVSSSNILGLHQEFNISHELYDSDDEDNCTSRVYTKLGLMSDDHLCSGRQHTSRYVSRASYLNQLCKSSNNSIHDSMKKRKDARGLYGSPSTLTNNDSDDDYGVYSLSDLTAHTKSNSNCVQGKLSDSKRIQSDVEEVVSYEEVELSYFTVTELYNSFGVLLQEEISNQQYRQWYSSYKDALKKKAKLGGGKVVQTPPTLAKKIQSVKFYRSDNIMQDEKDRGKCVVACLEQPTSNMKSFDLLNESKNAAHNERVAYILLFAVFPDIEKQLTTQQTNLHKKRVSIMKPIASTDKFVTSVCRRTPSGKEEELCRYVSTIDCFTDDFVGDREKTEPKLLVGLFRYCSKDGEWYFRATNDFALTPPSSIGVTVLEAKDIQSKDNDDTTLDDTQTTPTLRLGAFSKPQGIDTFCIVSYNGNKNRGKTVPKNSNPQYQQEFKFQLSNDIHPVHIDIFQSFAITSNLIGGVSLDIFELFNDRNKYSIELKTPRRKRATTMASRRDQGSLRLSRKPALVHEKWYDIGSSQIGNKQAKVHVKLTLEWL